MDESNHRNGTREFSLWRRLLSSVALVAVQLLIAAPAQAQSSSPSPSPEDIAAGMRIYRQKADCQACHGWAGDGRKLDSQMPDGTNLRTTPLNREALIMTIKCGRPGRGMPAFDRLAYSDGRCFGMTEADLRKKGLELFHPAATLQVREINAVTDFLLEKVVGKGPMDRAKCIEHWGSEVDVCKEFEE